MKHVIQTISLICMLLASMSSLASETNDRLFETINASKGLADNSVQIIRCTKTGRMIISTIGNLNFYDGVEFNHIDTHLDYQLPLDGYAGNYNLGFDRYHHIWLKNNHTVTCVDLYMERFVPDPQRIVKEMGCEEQVLDVFVDSIGDVWFETPIGLYDIQTKKTLSLLKEHDLQDIETYKGMILAFYDNGEEVAMSRETGEIVHQTAPREYDAGKYNQSSVIFRTDSICYLIRSGESESVLLQFNIVTEQWQTILEVPYHLNGLTLHKDDLYIASDKGYWVYSPSAGKLTHHEQVKLLNGRVYNAVCNTISFDKQGGMWLGTEYRGILYSRPHLSPIHVLEFSDPKADSLMRLLEPLKQNITEFKGKHANSIFTDSRNWTWCGTTSGLYAYPDGSDEPIVYNKKHGLLNNVVHAVIEDHHHNIWLSTSYGISYISFEDGKPSFVNSFNNYDNVPNESFVNGKALCLDDGAIVMQTVDHLVYFQPDHFTTVNKNNNTALSPKLIRLLVNGNFVESGEEVDGNIIIDRAITRVKDIWLNADQNSIALTFSGLNYFRPIQTCYRVRVKGIDDKWRVYSYFNGTDLVDTRGLLHLPIVGIKPGTYEVEVQVSMYPNVWDDSDVHYRWNIHVDQPWWQATGVYALLVLIVLAIAVYNIVLYSRNTRMKARLAVEEGTMVKRIALFMDRYNVYDKGMLAPLHEELLMGRLEAVPSTEFIELMMKMIPYLQAHPTRFSLKKLSEISNTDIVTLQQIFFSNLYKSPRPLIMKMRLLKAADMLRNTDKSIEDIAKECQFYTPNYFMGSFFHQYKKTPLEYRAEKT